MLLDELNIKYPKPPILLEDNTGAIFIMKNDQVGQRTKHIDVKWHHVRDMIRNKELAVGYLRSEDNPLDIMTKNTKEALFVKHSKSIKDGTLLVGAWNREDVVGGELVELADVMERTDEEVIFVCVPRPDEVEKDPKDSSGSLFARSDSWVRQGSSDGSDSKGYQRPGSDLSSSEDHDQSTGGSVGKTEEKAG